MNNTAWDKASKKFLKTELTKRDIKYKALAAKLASIGIKQSSNAIAAKIHKGRFSLTFFMQCMKAIGAEEIVLTDYFSMLNLYTLPANENQK